MFFLFKLYCSSSQYKFQDQISKYNLFKLTVLSTERNTNTETLSLNASNRQQLLFIISTINTFNNNNNLQQISNQPILCPKWEDAAGTATLRQNLLCYQMAETTTVSNEWIAPPHGEPTLSCRATLQATLLLMYLQQYGQPPRRSGPTIIVG